MGHRTIEPRQRRFARAMRSSMTEPEFRLWLRLRKHGLGGLKFRRQAAMGPYIADFFCAEKRLIVEIDGSQHFEGGWPAGRSAADELAGGVRHPRPALRQRRGADQHRRCLHPNSRGGRHALPLSPPLREGRKRSCVFGEGSPERALRSASTRSMCPAACDPSPKPRCGFGPPARGGLKEGSGNRDAVLALPQGNGSRKGGVAMLRSTPQP